jgi:hypothetical protein
MLLPLGLPLDEAIGQVEETAVDQKSDTDKLIMVRR